MTPGDLEDAQRQPARPAGAAGTASGPPRRPEDPAGPDPADRRAAATPGPEGVQALERYVRAYVAAIRNRPAPQPEEGTR